jgi:3-deoxy-manno-octulosonate cytidylyltransferase (CMP-KDO synthetase)
MKILGVIPARFASTRLEGKPLLLIGDKPMVVHVYQNALKSTSLNHVIIATDHQKIFDTCKDFGCHVIMTSHKHPSGTDRIIEVAKNFSDFDIIINIQGDEPFLNPQSINDLVQKFYQIKQAEIITLVKKIETSDELWSDSVVKCVKSSDGKALYFSRSVIPYLRNVKDKTIWHQTQTYWKHLGIYGYTQNALKKIQQLAPSSLENAENLEQLRWIENGISIYTSETAFQSLAVDTMEDYHKALKYWEEKKS